MKTKLKTFLVQCRVVREPSFFIDGKSAAAVMKRLQSKSSPSFNAVRRQYSDAVIVNITESK